MDEIKRFKDGRIVFICKPAEIFGITDESKEVDLLGVVAMTSASMRDELKRKEIIANEEKIGPYWIHRSSDPFGIPTGNPWVVLELKSCIYPPCGGSCYKTAKSFKTEDEARGWVTARMSEVSNG